MLASRPSADDARMLPLSNDSRPAYVIDASDRIESMNAAWRVFAGVSEAWLEEHVGQSVWRVLGAGEIRFVWEHLHRRVRGVGASLFAPMRIDSASERRLVDIELRPMADRAIAHILEPAWSEPRAAVALLDPAWPRDERTLGYCVWCNRVRVTLGVWEEIEEAQASLGIDASGPLPTLAPAACAPCKQSLLEAFPARVA